MRGEVFRIIRFWITLTGVCRVVALKRYYVPFSYPSQLITWSIISYPIDTPTTKSTWEFDRFTDLKVQGNAGHFAGACHISGLIIPIHNLPQSRPRRTGLISHFFGQFVEKHIWFQLSREKAFKNTPNLVGMGII